MTTSDAYAGFDSSISCTEGNWAADVPTDIRTFTLVVHGFHATYNPILCLGNSSRPITTDKPESPDAESTLETIFQARRERHVLVRITKSVYSTVAEAPATTIDDALSTGDSIGWSKLLLFVSVVSSRDHDSSTALSFIVRRNLLKYDSLLPTWTASSPITTRVTNMSPTKSLVSCLQEIVA